MFFTAQLRQCRILGSIPLTPPKCNLVISPKTSSHTVIPSQKMFRGACLGDVNAEPQGAFGCVGLLTMQTSGQIKPETRGFGEDSLTKPSFGVTKGRFSTSLVCSKTWILQNFEPRTARITSWIACRSSWEGRIPSRAFASSKTWCKQMLKSNH